MLLMFLLLASVVFIIVSSTWGKLHPFLSLIAAALLFGLFSGMSLPLIIESINDGFGKTLGGIGLVIILGVIIGAFLEHSGGALRLAESVLKLTGKKRVPLGMSLIGYIVSIPVFADSGFMLLSPLNKALTKKAKLSLSVTAIALAAGLMASHAMVPPTPGPIAAAGIIGADLGLVIAFGLVVSLCSLLIVLQIIRPFTNKIYIDPNPDLTESELLKKTADAPSTTLSFLPILIPIILILVKSFIEYMRKLERGFIFDLLSRYGSDEPLWLGIVNFLGTPVIALLIGVVISFLLPKDFDKKMLSTDGWVGKALKDAAIIIMITGAGGIFGKVLQNSGIATVISDLLGGYNLGIWLPFIVSAAIKTAQGSSTVAMITTASLVAPLIGELGFHSDVSIALVVVAIGAGSLVVSHANDSFFWVLTQMTGMDISQGYKLHSLASGLLGIVAVIIIFILSMVLG